MVAICHQERIGHPTSTVLTWHAIVQIFTYYILSTQQMTLGYMTFADQNYVGRVARHQVYGLHHV